MVTRFICGVLLVGLGVCAWRAQRVQRQLRAQLDTLGRSLAGLHAVVEHQAARFDA